MGNLPPAELLAPTPADRMAPAPADLVAPAPARADLSQARSGSLVTRFTSVYVQGTGTFLPGEPVANDAIDRYIAPLDRHSQRIKRRVLAENGIRTRHYAIDEHGATRWSSAQMAAAAVSAVLDDAGVRLDEISLLATGSSGGDVALPGFANMVQGELAAPPMETATLNGICAAGVMALKHAAQAVDRGEHARAVVATSEFPSRLFKRSRFAPTGYHTDFDAHFLRWMLSDGAGALLLGRSPAARGPALRLDWVHTRSFSGDFPACMQIGRKAGATTGSYLDYASVGAAEADGAFALRQDTRMLANLFDVSVHEYVRLVHAGDITPGEVDHFLCHYSSERLGVVCEELMTAAGVDIPRERWFSNLATRGNTGAASIFIMLADFVRERTLRPGERVLCFVPESGRFTASFLMFTVVEGASPGAPDETDTAPPAPATDADPVLARLLGELATVWHDYRSRAWRTPLVNRIMRGDLSHADYLHWMACWIPQVREGSLWMRTAIAHVRPFWGSLASIITEHANEEQHDFRILFDDYRAAGGTIESLDALARNPGGEALNAFMYATARRPDPVDMLGAIYVIEGTGRRIVPQLLPKLRAQLRLPERCFRFLHYHSANDVQHLDRWLRAVRMVLAFQPSLADAIVRTARATADLYLLQLGQAVPDRT